MSVSAQALTEWVTMAGVGVSLPMTEVYEDVDLAPDA